MATVMVSRNIIKGKTHKNGKYETKVNVESKDPIHEIAASNVGAKTKTQSHSLKSCSNINEPLVCQKMSLIAIRRGLLFHISG